MSRTTSEGMTREFQRMVAGALCIMALSGARGATLPDGDAWRSPAALPSSEQADGVRVRCVADTGDSIRLQYRMPAARVVADASGQPTPTADTPARLELGDAPSIGKPGRPVLPVVPCYVALPAGRRLLNVSVTCDEPSELPGHYTLAHAGEAPDPSVYGSDAPWPERQVEVVGVQRKRGVPVVILKLYPVVYRPLSGRVIAYSSLTLDVTTEPAATALTVADPSSPDYRPDTIRPVRSQVDNPDAIATYGLASMNADAPVRPTTAVPANMSLGSMGGFYNWEEYTNALASMHAQFPAICAAPTAIGVGWDGNPILMVKISDNPDVDEDEPEALVAGHQDASHPLSYTAALCAMWHLLENYGTDPAVTYLVNNRELYFVPVMNPDGLRYNAETAPNGGGKWYRNRRQCTEQESKIGHLYYGASIGNNYPFKWGYDDYGSAGYVDDNGSLVYYRGPYPASEPETQAMMAFVTNHTFRTALIFDNVSTLGAFQSYLYPYHYAEPGIASVPDRSLFEAYAARMARDNGHRVRQAGVDHQSNGGFSDWLYAQGTAPILAYVSYYELGTTTNQFSWPPANQILPLVAENMTAAIETCWGAGGKVETTLLSLEDGTLTPGGSENLVCSMENLGWNVSEPVTVSIVCTNPGITVAAGVWNAGPIPAHALTNNAASPFVVDIPDSYTSTSRLEIAVTLTQGEWTNTRYYGFGGGLCKEADRFEYVLITSRAIRDAQTTPNVRDLIARKQAEGLSATIVAIEDILSDPTYQGADDAETLRHFIRDAYRKWETDYVLLGGGADIVPARQLRAGIAASHALMGYNFTQPLTQSFDSDLYYQCLDGSYNGNGNAYWGEADDGDDGGDVDLLAELYVGRAPVDGANAMANFVFKTLAYADHPVSDDYLRTALMAGRLMHSGLGSGIFKYGKSYLLNVHHGANVAGYATAGFDTSGLFAVDTLYQWDDAQAGRPLWGKTALLSRINLNRYAVVNSVGPGSSSSSMSLSPADVDTMTNTKLFFAYAEDSYSVNIAVPMTTRNRHGAYAAVANTYLGAGQYNNTWNNFDGGSLRVHREFWDAYFGESVAQLGAMHADSHEDVLWMLDRPDTRFCVYTSTLYGDPHAAMRALPETPSMRVGGHSLDDSAGNGDGFASPGETIDLAITLLNMGCSPAVNVTATLSTTDTWVTVTQDTVSYGDVPAGAARSSLTSCTLDVAAGTPTPRTVSLNLDIVDTNGTHWAGLCNMTIYSAAAVSGTVSLDGGPATNVTVTWTGPSHGSVQTDADGHYAFSAIGGTYQVTAGRPEWIAPTPVEVTAPPAMTGVDFAFSSATVSGRVTQALTGDPVVGAIVSCTGLVSAAVQTAADGTYAFTRVFGRPATLTLTAEHPAYARTDALNVSVPPDVADADFLVGVPDIGVTPAAIDVTVAPGTVVTQQLVISENGGARLNWRIHTRGTGLAHGGGEVVRRLPIPPDMPSGLAGLAFDGSRLWMRFGKRVASVDPSDGSVLSTIDLNYDASAIDLYGFASDGDRLWTADYPGRKIIGFNPDTGQQVKSLDFPYDTALSDEILVRAIAWDGQYLVVMEKVNPPVWPQRVRKPRLYRMNPDSGAIVDIAWFEEWTGADGNAGAICCSDGFYWLGGFTDSLTALDPLTKSIVSVIDVDVEALGLGFEPVTTIMCPGENGRIWIQGENTDPLHPTLEVWLVDTDSPQWLATTPYVGSEVALGATNVSVVLDATALDPGENLAVIHVLSNDPDQPDLTVPVRLVVTSPYTISGAVTLDGSPLPGARLMHRGAYSGETETDTNGLYTLYVSTGTFHVAASYGAAPDTAPVEVTVPPAAANVDFAFVSATVSGRVTDVQASTPLGGATVRYYGPVTGETQTAPDGTYTISRVVPAPVALTLVCSHPDYYESDDREVTTPPAATGIDFALGLPELAMITTNELIVLLREGEVFQMPLSIANLGGSALGWNVWTRDTTVPVSAAGTVVRSFALPPGLLDTSANYVACDGACLWVFSRDYDGPLAVALDTTDGHMVRSISYDGLSNLPTGLAAVPHRLWISAAGLGIFAGLSPGERCEYSSINGRRRNRLTVDPANMQKLAWGEGRLWSYQDAIGDDEKYRFVRLNPDTGAIEQKVGNLSESALRDRIRDLTFQDGSLWALTTSYDAVRFSAQDGSVLSSFAVPGDCSGIASASDGRLWVVDRTSRTAYLVESGRRSWLTMTPLGGVVPALSTNATATLAIDAGVAGLGTHQGTLHVQSNEPGEPVASIQVTLIVASDEDGDGDGVSNFEEAVAGTNPADRNSVLRVESIVRDVTGVELTFRSVTGRSYAVQYRTDLAGPGEWTSLTNDWPATGNLMRFIDAGTATQRFYRVWVRYPRE